MNKFNRSLKGLGRKTAQALLFSSALLTSACAAIPDLGPAPEAKEVQTYAGQQAFQAPTTEWPVSTWWTAYGDAQLNALVAEALAGAPSLAQAEARVRQADAIAQQVGASRLPQVSADASIAAVKQSYNNGVPAAFVPQGWNDTGRAALNFSYEFDFWGKNRAAVAAATSEAEAVRADLAQARLTISTSIASAYADLVQLYAESASTKSAVEVRTRMAELFPSDVRRAWKTKAQSARRKPAVQGRRRSSPPSTKQSPSPRPPLRRCSARDRIAGSGSNRRSHRHSSLSACRRTSRPT